MAVFGAKNILFSPIKEEPASALPEYTGVVTEIGALVKADLTVNNASGEIYANNKLDEKIEEFVSGSLAVEVSDMTDEVESVVFGSTLTTGDTDSGDLIDDTGDTIPYGCISYYKTLRRKGKTVYRGFFYPKAKAVMGNDTGQTKGSSITLASTPLTFSIEEPETGQWRYRHTFDTEAEVIAWQNTKMGKATT